MKNWKAEFAASEAANNPAGMSIFQCNVTSPTVAVMILLSECIRDDFVNLQEMKKCPEQVAKLLKQLWCKGWQCSVFAVGDRRRRQRLVCRSTIGGQEAQASIFSMPGCSRSFSRSQVQMDLGQVCSHRYPGMGIWSPASVLYWHPSYMGSTSAYAGRA